MATERFTGIACSYLSIEPRRYVKEPSGRETFKRFAICQRDGRYCVPGIFTTNCPDWLGRPCDLAVVEEGEIYNQLGCVTIVTDDIAPSVSRVPIA